MRVAISLLIVIVVLMTAACAAVDIGPANTANGLLRAVQNAPGTFMMASEKLIMIAWPEGTSYGFAVFTKDGKGVQQFAELASCTGTRAGCETMSDLVTYLKSIGWTRIWELPAPLVTQIHALAKFFGTTASTYQFSLFVLPVGALEYDVTDVLYPQTEG